MEQTFQTLKTFSHKVGINFWHIVLATKYRYQMFGKFKQKNIAEASIRKVAHRHGIEIHLLSVMPEHVHMLVTLPRGMTDSKALMLLKGGSAYHFFKNHERSRLRLPRGHLWSAGGCAVTVGYNELSTVENYIKNQNEHHAVA
ncbi:MAG: IS200/IS605 family transposase [Nanoarchaeota archaeon]|nr:IS200/IS605 family transposase [Nanoarchaeota archaeon]